MVIKFNGKKDKKGKIFIKSASLVEEKNKIEKKNINFDENFRLENFDNINLDYADKDDKRNSVKFIKKEIFFKR